DQQWFCPRISSMDAIIAQSLFVDCGDSVTYTKSSVLLCLCLFFISALETFSLAVLLTSLTTLRCLCVLGPNIQAWIRVFSRHGAMSVWDTCLQITVACTLIGAWVGAFPIPLDWDRPWQVWPVSCSLGSLFGYLTGLVAAPAWIHYHRKQLTYKCK
uniref:Phosphatidylinositol glycan anchor biosynthesis class F n=1 Tax=Pundamilia nyererei TaxID=303518 RepID=A0A3B4F2L7_9CICH